MSEAHLGISPPETIPTSRRPVKIWLILETVLGIVAVPGGGFLALLTPMMFDAPGSETHPPVIMLASSIVAFPVLYVAGLVLGWVAVARGRDRGALWFSLMPALAAIAVIIAIVWLQVSSGGRFTPPPS